MNRIRPLPIAVSIVATLSFVLPVRAAETPPAQVVTAAAGAHGSAAILWSDRGNIGSLNLVYGPGGKAHQPSGKFTFVKEDMNGTSPKFEVEDEQGVVWKAKLGEEARSETAATRLVWAAGYFADEDYYFPELRVDKMPRLHRGRQYVSADGVVRGVRLERKLAGQKKTGEWSWFKHPLAGTKEFNGLRVMMALTNNWDLKTINNAIYEEKGEQSRYVVSDLGATFGRTGNPLTRSKSNMRDYSKTKFVQKVGDELVDFHLSSRSFFLTVFDVPNYITRTKMQRVAKHIPRSHARWLGQLLGQLSAEQIRDCFRSAGYSPDDVEGFTTVIQGRIADLNKL